MNVSLLASIQQKLDISLEVKKEQENLAEKILAAISHTAEKAKGGPAAYLTKAHATITSLQDKASTDQKPVLDTVVQALSNQLSLVAPAAPKAVRRKMKAAQAIRAEFVPTPAPKATSTKSAAHAKTLGDDQPLPVPTLPPSQAPSYTAIPDGPEWRLQDPLSTVKQYFEYINAHPSDPTGMMNLMNFLAMLSKGNQMTPEIQSMIQNNGDLVGDQGGIDMWSNQMADYAFFAGYNGATGEAGMKAYLNDTLAHLQDLPSNPLTAEMIRCINNRLSEADTFASNHTTTVYNPAGGGGAGSTTTDLTWTYDGVTYDWTNPGTTDYNDQDVIQSLMNGQSADGTMNPFIANMNLLGMEKDYRVTALDQLLKEFKDPLMAITLWMLQSDDNQTESKVSGENENTDILTKATNVFANNLTNSIAAFGSGTGTVADAQNLARTLFTSHVYFDQTPQLNPISGQFDTDVYQGISNLDGGEVGKILQQVMTTTDPDTLKGLVIGLNNAFQTSGTTPNTTFQAATNITNELSSLTTGQSKTITTEQANDVSTISAIIKTADAVISLQKMYDKVIQHFGD